jgi:hypothetical protein
LKTIGDPDIGKGMCENASLLRRFVDPEAFVPLIVPRIRGDDDAEFTQVSVHCVAFVVIFDNVNTLFRTPVELLEGKTNF